MVILCTTRLKIKKKFTFCPHSAFVCYVYVSEQTANISMHSTKWFVVITGTECVISGFRRGLYEKCALLGQYAVCRGNSLSIMCVHSAERTKSLNTFQSNFRLQKSKQLKKNHNIQNYKHCTHMQFDPTVTGRTWIWILSRCGKLHSFPFTAKYTRSNSVRFLYYQTNWT